MSTFPVTPYFIRVETLSGIVEMDFAATQWHLPSTVQLTGRQPAIDALQSHFNQYPCGMWGYPIEQLQYCSPMDIHANLTTNESYYNDPKIQKFDVIGYVPDELPDSIHPDNYDPDDDDDSEEE